MPKTKNKLIVREVITIGSDPEFAIVSPNGNKTLHADDVFKPKRPQASTCDFGYDGHAATGEIRPKPADNPGKAVETIKKLLEANKSKYPEAYKYNLMATSRHLSLGGHIHFGNRKFLDRNSWGDGNGLSKVGVALVHNLDNLLAFPSMYLENPDDAVFRRHSSYGGFSDARPQPWGFEYRTLSSFIASEQLTSSIFYLGYAIADATLNFAYKCKDLVKKEGFDNAFRSQFRELLKPHLTYVFKEHRKLPLYKENITYKKKIDIFDDMVQNEVPEFGKEIKTGWNIEFDITDFWKIDRLETLLDKVTKLLIAIHTLKQKNFKPIIFKFADGGYKDLGCHEITRKVNLALNNLVDKEVIKSQEWHTLRVIGLKESRGNEVWLGSMNLKEKRKKQILGYLWEIASEFSHKTKIEDIKFEPAKIENYSIAFGRKLREENLLIAEVMVVITLLLINRELFKQTQKIKGKTRKLLVTKHKVVGTIIKNLKKMKKFKAVIPLTQTPKLNSIKLPLAFDLNKTYNELHQELLEMSAEYQMEVSSLLANSLKGKISPIINTACIKRCGDRIRVEDRKLIDLCPYHIAFLLKELSLILPPMLYPWNYIFYPGEKVRCPSCNGLVTRDGLCAACNYCNNCCECQKCTECEKTVHPDDFCNDCDRCIDCCTYCSYCESHECHHGTCNGCGEDFDYENYCLDCENCLAHCECSTREQQPTPRATRGVATAQLHSDYTSVRPAISNEPLRQVDALGLEGIMRRSVRRTR